MSEIPKELWVMFNSSKEPIGVSKTEICPETMSSHLTEFKYTLNLFMGLIDMWKPQIFLEGNNWVIFYSDPTFNISIRGSGTSLEDAIHDFNAKTKEASTKWRT